VASKQPRITRSKRLYHSPSKRRGGAARLRDAAAIQEMREAHDELVEWSEAVEAQEYERLYSSFHGVRLAE